MIQIILPERPRSAHKGDFGKVLVIAGSEKYPGAALLASRACYRVGAGLVTVASSKELIPIYLKELPEATHLELSEVLRRLNEYIVVLFGPGFGAEKKQLEFTKKLLTHLTGKKAVIDADGLNNLAKIEKWWEKLGSDTILTPHPGEMSRLTGLSIEEIQSKRSETAQEFAKKWHKVVVLKGAESVTASPNRIEISKFSNPALATAGTGDVLAGIIAGLLAQGLRSFEAAKSGVYIHGLAGELWSEKYGDAGMLASDLIELLPKVMDNIKHGQG